LKAEGLDARRALLVPRDDPFYVSVLDLLKEWVDQERLREPGAALRLADIAFEVAEFSDIPRCMALAAWAKGNVLIHQGEYGECLRLYRHAARFFAGEGAEEEAARLTANQAWALKNLGRYDDAIEAIQAALVTLRQLPPSPFLASALSGLGTFYRLVGCYDDALATFDEAERVYAVLDAPVRQARTAINQANVLENLDRFEEALVALWRARGVLDDQGHLLEVARADLNLGITYTRLGRYDQALQSLDRAESGFVALENAMETSVVALYRADLYAAFNLYDDLLGTFLQDWQLFEEREMQWQAARAALHQAVAWRWLGDPAQAEDLFDRAVDAFDRVGDPVWLRLATLERAALWAEQGAWARALPVAEETATSLQTRGLPMRAAESSLLAAHCFLALGQPAEAAERFEKALELGQAMDAPSLRYRADHGLGQVALTQKRRHDAYGHFRQAVETVESERQRLQVEDFRLSFLEDKLRVYQDMVLLCLEMGRDDEAFAYVERAKSGALVDLLLASLGRQPTATEGPEGELMARLSSLREQLNWHRSKLEGSGPGERGEETRTSEAEVWGRILAIEREMVHTWRGLQQRASFYAPADSLDGCGLDTVQSSLRQDEVLVQYYVCDEITHAFVVGSDGLRGCLRLTSATPQIAEAVDGLSTTLRAVRWAERQYVAGTLLSLSQQQLGWLYDDLIAPLTPLFGDAQRLLVAPDGRLFDVPFHALYDGAGYLLERYEIAYTPSGGALWLCQENYRRRSDASQRAFVMGCSPMDRLPYVGKEIESVAQAMPGATVARGDEATLAMLKEYAGESWLLHLATHAVFRRDNPLFSALQLAGGDWLRTMDLYTLQLRGALVTLSGCETGRHRMLGGDLVGLSRGFLYAGASGLVLSLWPVDDVSTALLMEDFYGHLAAGESVTLALTRAQEALGTWQSLEDGRQVQPYAHPYYWAPFCFFGAPDLRAG
jgi:CHAT domain-containing protein/tetratricopeptide (TPR) repeat protein